MPYYTHDCPHCIFLGEHKGYDLYYCPPNHTVIARYGHEPPENKSGWDSTDLDLQEAQRRSAPYVVSLDQYARSN